MGTTTSYYEKRKFSNNVPQQSFIGNNYNQALQKQRGFYPNQYQYSQQPKQNNYFIQYREEPSSNMDKLSYNRDEYKKLVMFYFKQLRKNSW